jgi:hypothetical protein
VKFFCVHNSSVKKVAHYVGEHVMMDVIIGGLPAVPISCCQCLVLWEDEPGREQVTTEWNG